MPLDKKLYRQAYKHYQRWSEIKLLERAEKTAQLSSTEAFQQYAELFAFMRQLCPEPSATQRQEKLEALECYYAQVQKLEAWRQARGKAAGIALAQGYKVPGAK